MPPLLRADADAEGWLARCGAVPPKSIDETTDADGTTVGDWAKTQKQKTASKLSLSHASIVGSPSADARMHRSGQFVFECQFVLTHFYLRGKNHR